LTAMHRGIRNIVRKPRTPIQAGMTRLTPTRPSKPERWRPREEILKEYWDSLSPDELRDVRPAYYWLKFGYKAWQREQAKANFNPDQPRVSAGNPDGGQWRSESGSQATDFSAVRRSNRIAIDYSRALTGVSTIDNTIKALSETLSWTMEKMDFIPTWTPRQFGTAVHVLFGTTVRFQGLPGIGFEDVEHSFADGGSADYYGQPGSIRTDVLLRNDIGDIIASYDVKTGDAGLSVARVRELRAKSGVGPDVPIIELSVRRGGTIKARVDAGAAIGEIMARLWDPLHHRDALGWTAGR